MINPVFFLDVANVLFLLATAPSICAVLKNWRKLKGYSLTGAACLLVAAFFVEAYLYSMKHWFSFLITACSTLLYWLLVVISLVLKCD